jgi:hypothetical protein
MQANRGEIQREKSKRIPTASKAIIYAPMTAFRIITQYSPAVLASLDPALIPLPLDVMYQATSLTSDAVLKSEVWKSHEVGEASGIDGSTSRT